MRTLAAAALVLVVTACGGERGTPTQPTATPTPPAAISALARSHLDQLLTLMQNNSIRRLTIDWPAFRADVVAEAGAAQAIPDLFPAIRLALTRIGDGHSSYRSASGTNIFVPTRSCLGSGGPARPPGLPETIGYVWVGSFGGTMDQATTFATNIQNAIRNDDRDGMVGWIVDLRGNGGGNMWPMIAGVGPVLGDGLVGFFIPPAGASTSWEYRDGGSYVGPTLAQRVAPPYQLRRPGPRVAVLTDTAVASSGEATVIAFRQRPDTRSFGLPTCGLSTANAPFTLDDGAVLNLTTSVMADRTRTAYGDQVQPDEVIADRNELAARAVAWLQTGR